ncbi:MAG: hypothetical protein OHK93_004947 [Ramalina farinacea]|uniref:Uncharacterized protein n=1 Tax=Ramalina farinacea TaxID=258253 RepID=A0AA43QZK3_9LECA|nr:hypothetical protein [Ramalina farinacea]
MLAHVFPLLLLTFTTSTSGIRIARVMPTPSDNPALMHRHDAYINQKVYNDPHNILNHDAWYLRHAQVDQTLIDPLVPANETRAIEVFGTPAPSSQNTTRVFASSLSSPKASATMKTAASSTTEASNMIDSIKAIGMTKALATLDTNEGSWDVETDEACIAALQASQAAAASSSGMAACYNVKSLNGTTGSFEAELRLYQLSEPSAQWDQGQSEGLNLGLNYARATVKENTARKDKRAIVDRQPTKASEMEKQNVNARSPRLKPRQLETLELQGQVDDDAVPELEDM